MRALRSAVAVLTLCSWLGCGSGVPAPDARAITVTITPAVSTVPVGGTLDLRGDATGFTATPSVIWYMREGIGTNDAFYCGLDYNDPAPPSTACPCGYVRFQESKDGVPSPATYHAPTTAQVCHPTFQAMQSDGYAVQAVKYTAAEVTVTP